MITGRFVSEEQRRGVEGSDLQSIYLDWINLVNLRIRYTRDGTQIESVGNERTEFHNLVNS